MHQCMADQISAPSSLCSRSSSWRIVWSDVRVRVCACTTSNLVTFPFEVITIDNDIVRLNFIQIVLSKRKKAEYKSE